MKVTKVAKVTKVTAYSRFWLFLSVSLHQHLAFKAMATGWENAWDLRKI
jgi:hypothetical protein